MINCEEFNELPLHVKAEFIKQAGFLVNLHEENSTWSLYAIGRYYLEARIDKESQHLLDVRIFTSWDNLDKYCNEMVLVDSMFKSRICLS